MGRFFYLKLSFFRPWGSFLGTWETILMILGSRGTPNGHTEAQMSTFIHFRVDLGTLLGSTLGTILWFSVIWGGKVGDGFQVHAFSDPGMEMMPECNGCMCYNHSKNNVFWMILLFPLIHWFGVLRERFRSHFDVFWWPWGHLFWFLRVLEIGLKFDDFW